MTRKPGDNYTFLSFCWDAFMVTITAGYWLIWLLIRELTLDLTPRYTVWHFLMDNLMITITAGFWIVWIIIRETKNKRT